MNKKRRLRGLNSSSNECNVQEDSEIACSSADCSTSKVGELKELNPANSSTNNVGLCEDGTNFAETAAKNDKGGGYEIHSEECDKASANSVKKKKIKLPEKRDLPFEEHPETKEKKAGIIYFQTIPPFFTVSRMRQEMSRFGEVGRIYLQAEKRRDTRGKKRKRYIEGWVEFKKKGLAKRVAASLNNTAVGGSRRSAARETLWTMKYLSGFKWTHLMQQLNYEKRVEQHRLRAEISQAKRQADFFAEQIEKGAQLKSLEEKVLKKGGLWEKFQRQVQQRKTIKKDSKTVSNTAAADDQLLQMIFAD